MAIFVNEDKSMWMYEGDTGNIRVAGLPNDIVVRKASFSIFDEETGKIKLELFATVVNGIATFAMTEEKSNTLKEGDYTWALKLCDNAAEDTLVPETKLENGVYVAQPAPAFTVRAKRAEGQHINQYNIPLT